uniref:Uncharacterized protein n=1 Tax=Arundo donax TaxID=35708 RepID=A0A0A9BAW3_ARUDO
MSNSMSCNFSSHNSSLLECLGDQRPFVGTRRCNLLCQEMQGGLSHLSARALAQLLSFAA